MIKKTVFKSLLGIAVSALLLYFAVRDVNLNELIAALSQANYFYVIPAFALTIVVFWFRAIRWRYMLIAIKPVRNSQLFTITVIGFMVNNVLPVRIGEVVRAYILGKRENLSKSLSFATVIVERILDGLTIMSFLAPGIVLFSLPLWLKQMGTLLLLFYFSLIGFLFLLNSYAPQVTAAITKVVSPFSATLAKRVVAMLGSFCEGLKIFKSRSQVFWIALYSYLIWVAASLIIMLFLHSFHFNVPLYAPFLLLAIIALGAAIPSSPGFIGTLQFFCVAGLALFGISESESLGFSIVYHVSQYVPVTLLGLFFMWRGHLHFKDITGGATIGSLWPKKVVAGTPPGHHKKGGENFD